MASNMLTTQARVSTTLLGVVVLVLLVGHALSQHRQKSPGNDESAQLIKVLRDEQVREREPERLVEAIELLGQSKSVAAIDDLVQLLTFRRTFEWDTPRNGIIEEPHFISIDARYPAAGALFQIGMPSVPALKKVIEEEKTGSLASENAIYTVTQIFRDAPLEGVEYLRDAAAKASSTQAAQRLSEAANKMKRFLQQ